MIQSNDGHTDLPFLEDLKIFEMPPLGFLGFPPFAVECAVIYGMLVGFGLAPAWGQIRRKAEQRPLRRPLAVLAWLLAAAFMWGALQGMLRFNVDSYAPRLKGLGLPGPVRQYAEESGHDDAFALERALRDPVVRRLLRTENVNLETLDGLLELAVHRGIGVRHAQALASVGVKRVADLKGRDPEELARQLTELEGLGRPLSPSRVKVWIRTCE